jgi:hypothetical protein
MVRDVPTILELLQNRSVNSVNSPEVTEVFVTNQILSPYITQTTIYVTVNNSLTIFTAPGIYTGKIRVKLPINLVILFFKTVIIILLFYKV